MSENFLSSQSEPEPEETTIDAVQKPGDYPFRVPDIYSVRRISSRVGVDGNVWTTLYCVKNTNDSAAAFERGMAVNKVFHDIAVRQRDKAQREVAQLKAKLEQTALSGYAEARLTDVDRRLALVEMALKEVCEDLPNLSARLVELAEKKLDAGVMVAVADDISELMTKVIALELQVRHLCAEGD